MPSDILRWSGEFHSSHPRHSAYQVPPLGRGLEYFSVVGKCLLVTPYSPFDNVNICCSQLFCISNHSLLNFLYYIIYVPFGGFGTYNLSPNTTATSFGFWKRSEKINNKPEILGYINLKEISKQNENASDKSCGKFQQKFHNALKNINLIQNRSYRDNLTDNVPHFNRISTNS